ncbi:MAG: hypothetical protein ACQEP2_06110 [Actinomycetota bacterium]
MEENINQYMLNCLKCNKLLANYVLKENFFVPVQEDRNRIKLASDGTPYIICKFCGAKNVIEKDESTNKEYVSRILEDTA